MRYSIIRDIDSFLEFSNDWERLLLEINCNSLHMSWPFVETWVKIYGTSYAIRVIVFFDNERVVAFTPFMIKKKKSKFGIPYQELRFLCDDDALSFDYLDFLILDDHRQKVLKFLYSALLSIRFDVINLRNTTNICPFGGGTEHISRKVNSSLYANLPKSWDKYFNNRSKNFRQNLRTFMNRSNVKYDIKYLSCDRDIVFEDGFNKLVELNLMRWGDRGDSFRSEKYIDFHKRIMKKMLKEDMLFLRFLSMNDEIVSANYSILCCGILYVLQMGRNPDYDKYGVGHLLISMLIREAIEKNIKRIDFLTGESEYKKRWTDQHFNIFQIVIYKGCRGKLLSLERRCKKLYYAFRHSKKHFRPSI